MRPYGEGPSPDNTPPTSSAPLYRLKKSKGLVGGSGEPRELLRCVGQKAHSTPGSILFCLRFGSESPTRIREAHALLETTKADGGLFHVGRGEGA